MSVFSVFNQRRSSGNLELLSMLLLGLICGTCLSQLLQRARLQFFDDVTVTDSELSTPSSQTTLNATRILCLVVASPLHTRLEHIERSWGRRCHKLLFWGKQRGEHLSLKQRHTNSWAKTRNQLQHVYQHYYDDYDWFLKVPDDTYVIMENLQHFLQEYKTETPIYFGGNDWEQVKQGFVSGAAGYVFSKAALQRFMHLGHGNGQICSNRNYGIEHVEIARCLRNTGVIAGDSRDELGLSRFVPFPPYTKNKSQGLFSTSAISFHYGNAEDFAVLDYVIYKVRPFGVHQILNQYQKMPPKLPTTALNNQR